MSLLSQCWIKLKVKCLVNSSSFCFSGLARRALTRRLREDSFWFTFSVNIMQDTFRYVLFKLSMYIVYVCIFTWSHVSSLQAPCIALRIAGSPSAAGVTKSKGKKTFEYYSSLDCLDKKCIKHSNFSSGLCCVPSEFLSRQFEPEMDEMDDNKTSGKNAAQAHGTGLGKKPECIALTCYTTHRGVMWTVRRLGGSECGAVYFY